MSSTQQLPEEWKELSTRPPERPFTSTRRSISRSGSGRAGGRVAGVATGNQHGTHGIAQTTTTTTIISITGIAVIALFLVLVIISTAGLAWPPCPQSEPPADRSSRIAKRARSDSGRPVHNLCSGEKRCFPIEFLHETFVKIRAALQSSLESSLTMASWSPFCCGVGTL
jgi:hypothetical protein